MANITLLGANYTDVPAIDLPQTGGGTVRFYENGGTPSGPTYETYFDGSITVSNNVATIPSLAELYFAQGETWRVTWDGVQYICNTDVHEGWLWYIGNHALTDATDDGTGEPFCLYNYGGGFMACAARTNGTHTLKLEKQTSSGGTNQDYEDALTAFGVQSNLASGITALTTYANEITGESDTNLSDAVRSLADGYGQGGSSAPPWVSSVETVTIGANSVTNTSGVKSYFNGKTPYFAVVLKSAPTTNNQIVAMVNNAASALRYRNNAVGIANVSTSYDAKLIEGTQYDIYHF